MSAVYAEPHHFAMPRFPSRRVAIGVGVSLVAHAVLLLAVRSGLVGRPAPAEVPQRMMVWVRPVPPPPLVVPAVPRPEPRPVTPSRRDPAPKAAARPIEPSPVAPSTPVIAVQPAPAAAAPDFTVPAQQAATPRFDAEAAKAAARKIASDDVRSGAAPAEQISSETKLARSIAKAKRPDCKDGIPGGLLAPIYLLMEKKDHGCKW